ncbi:MAG: DUF4474 domain-containing protein [Clostridia bacterium]|nr:DUF4474 domain-containing protein [Clostridia bacterium]
MLSLLKRIIAVILSAVMIPTGLSYSGKSVFGPAIFDVTLDEQTHELCELVKESSYLDIEKIVTEMPNPAIPAKIIGSVFLLNTEGFRNLMYSLRDSCYASGQNTLGKVFYLIGAYFRGFESCYIHLEKQEGGYYEFLLDVTYSDGYKDTLHSGAYYNPETGLFYGRDDKGMFEIGFNFDIKEMIVYATVNSWMRDFGFCLGYDIFTYITPLYFYHTRRFKFDYAGKEWMIQVWKGMYVIANGAEVGIYNRKPHTAVTYYDSVGEKDMMKMSFSLYHDDSLLFSRPEENHWWINGFKLSKTLYSADELTLKFTIEMKDREMLEAFCKSVDGNIWGDVSYTVDGLKVSLVW